MAFKWFGNLFRSKVDKHLDRQFEEAGVVIARHAKALVGVQYPPASSPGEPPRRRTGKLQRSITYQVERKGGGHSLKIFAAAPYGEFLETGTGKMAARPWRKRSYRETVKRVKDILLKPLP